MKYMISMAAAVVMMAAPAFASEHGGGHGHAKAEGHAATSESMDHEAVADSVLEFQRNKLKQNTKGKGFGPQSPRDIDAKAGNNKIIFNSAPAYTDMNLCNIHFHKNAEHKGGEFTIYAGNGDGHGNQSGYRYDTSGLSAAELSSTGHAICSGDHGSLSAGDTIEVHYVHSAADITPGPTLASCLAKDVINNPQLRVETQVYVLVNDKHALDFGKLTKVGKANGHYQALGIPANTGTAIQYEGSTTGPGYNEAGSPFQVTWNVRPQVAKVNIDTVGKWCKGNEFNEDHAHGVRNLVMNKDLLSVIK